MNAQHIVNLAQLKLTATELEKFQRQLTEILTYVDQIKKLKLETTEPTSQVTGLENVFRTDEVKPSLELKQGFFKTKLILIK